MPTQEEERVSSVVTTQDPLQYYATYQRLTDFLRRTTETAYSEPESSLHTDITKSAWGRVRRQVTLLPTDRVLDIGCGSGLAVEMFLKTGADVLGITCVEEEAVSVNERFPGAVRCMDMHDIGQWESYFQLIWCRHVLEHSPIPRFMLDVIYRSLKAMGFVYIEVPGYMTSSRHEDNPNHYTIVPSSVWENFISRAGLTIIDKINFSFSTPLGDDTYFGFLARR